MAFQFKLSSKQAIRAEVTEFKGRSLLSIRMWWFSEEDDDWRPSGKGFTVPIDRAEDFGEALSEWFGGKGAKLIAKALREQDDDKPTRRTRKTRDEDEEDEKPVRRTTKTKKTVRSLREEPAPRARTKASAKTTRTKRSARR